MADDGASNEFVGRVREYAAAEHNEVFVLCAKIEEEISDLDEADKKEFLAELGVETSGLDRLIAASYKLLGLISYLTAGPQESRAWTITKGTKAPQAAGKTIPILSAASSAQRLCIMMTSCVWAPIMPQRSRA